MIPVLNFDHLNTLPNPPVLIRGCVGECCGLIKSNIILKDTPLYQYPDKDSKIVDSLKKGTKFDEEKSEFFVRVNKYGSATINGKNQTVIHGGSEGMVLYFDGKNANYSDECVACIPPGKLDHVDGANKFKYVEAKTEDWIQMYYGKKYFGWTNEKNFELKGCN